MLQREWTAMRKSVLLLVCLVFAGLAGAREHDYQRGTLLRMD